MKKLILFLLPIFALAQNPTNFPYGIKNAAGATNNTPTYIVTQETDGVHKKTPAAIIEKTANKTSTVTNYSETLYPNEKAVHDGLDMKLNISDLPTNLTLYPTTTASDVAGYVKMVTDIHDADYNTIAVDVSTPAITTTAQLVSRRISAPGVLIGQPGVFNITTFGNIRHLSGTGTATFYFEVYHRDSLGVETLICTSSISAPVIDGGYTEFSASALWDDGIFDATDRIVIKSYANRIAGGSDPVYQFQFGGATPVRTLLPVPFSVVDAGYEMKINKQNSLAVDGSGIKYPTVDAVNKVVYFVTPKQFGAIEDGVTDDSVAFQNFLNSYLAKKIPANKTYKIETELIISNPCELDFNNSTLTTNSLLRLLSIKSSNVTIKNGNFTSNKTGDFTAIVETEPYANSWLIGCKLIDGESFSDINITNNSFSAPSGSLNAVKLISHRSGFGGLLKHINIVNNRFKNIGRMAVEVLGEGATEWYSNVNVSDNYFDNLGVWSSYGMAISFSGLGTENFISKNIINQAKDVAIENAGANNTYILNNTVKNPKTGTTPMAVNSSDSGIRGLGNISLNNSFEGTYARGIQVIYQNNYFSQGNRVDKAESLALINEVSNSKFIADYFNSNLNSSVILQNTSSNNVFDNCIFSVFETLVFTDNITCQTSSSNNYFSNSKFINSTFGGVSLAQSGGAINNIIEKQIVKDNLTTLSDYGITDAVTINTPQVINDKKTFSGTYPSVSSFVRGFVFNPTLVQTDSYSTLVAVDLDPTFSLGATEGDGGHMAMRSSAKINYSSDISSTFDNRSLVDKAYADLKAPVASPAFTGTPTAPTATTGTNTTQLATTAFVQTEKNLIAHWTKTGNDIQNNNTGEVIIKPLTKLSVLNASNVEVARMSNTGDVRGKSFTFGTQGSGMFPSSSSGEFLEFRANNGNINTPIFNFKPDFTSANGVMGGFGFVGIYSGYTIAPTSGNVDHTLLQFSPTINQTGGANGITRGIYINPTLTSAVDFRAIEVTAGKSIFQEVSLNNLLKLKEFTVATLPTPTGTAYATVTDALAPSYLVTVVGGGSIVCPVFYNGSVWVSH